MEPSAGFNSDVVIYGFAEPLLAVQIFLRRLYRNMSEKELNLVQFASGTVTKASAGESQIMWRKFRDSEPSCIFLFNVTDHLFGHVHPPDLSRPADSTENSTLCYASCS